MCLARMEFIGNRDNKGRRTLPDMARIDVISAGFTVTSLMETVAEFDVQIESTDFINSVVRTTGNRASFEDSQ